LSLNLAVVLRESGRRHPHRTAIIADEHHTSWAELDTASDRLAEGLRRRGLVPGDAVALQLPNVPQFVIAWFGILKAGLVGVPVNVLFKRREVAHVLGDSDARLLLTWAGSAEEARKGAADAGVASVLVLGGDPGESFEELLAVEPDDPDGVLVPRDPGDVAAIVYTASTPAPRNAGYPRSVEFRSELPISDTGTILKRAL
jgi:long-chain acyl-CoA synthetase